MALLQIAEPGQSPVPHQQQLAIGIDLGTTYSLVAVPGASATDTPRVLPDENGQVLLPSVVRYLPQKLEVGSAAIAGRLNDPRNTIASVKRFMGLGLSDVAHLETQPYDFSEEEGMVQFRTCQGEKSPVEVSSEILKALYRRATVALGKEIVGAVITVPAHFNDAQRQATKDAARLAGLHVLRLLNEPTAAAVAYGLDRSVEGLYAIYDLGGGTFDISILRLTRGVFEVLATGGDTALGGDDFDQRLYDWLLEKNNLQPLSGSDSNRLFIEARRIKEELTTQESATVDMVLVDKQKIQSTLSRSEFFALTEPLVDKTLVAVRQTMRSAKLLPAEVTGVVMVGGASRMLHVQRAVEKYFDRTPLTDLDPDQVVALGAARQAGALTGQAGTAAPWMLLDVVPLSLGVETMGGLVEKIISRHATLPVARSQEFTTAKDGQTAMSIHILQGERERVTDCRSLGRFILQGLPPMAAGTARIRVVFQVDADGLLSVSAREMTIGVEASVQVKPSYGLSEERIAQMLRDAQSHSAEDVEVRQRSEAEVDATRLLDFLAGAMNQDAQLLSDNERRVLMEGMEQLKKALMDKADVDVLQSKSAALEKASHAFASRRMDEALNKALSGRKLEELL